MRGKFSNFFYILVSVVIMIALNGCSQPPASLNNPPLAPSNPSPLNGATNVNITPTLSWECSDPDGDPLSYDIYFGTDPNKLPVIKDDHPSTSLILETITGYKELQNETTYYWMVVAKDSKGGVTPSPIWNFTTSKPARLKWKFETYNRLVSGPAIAPDGTIYIGSEDSNLYAINPDGSLKWKYNLGTYIRSSPSISSDGTIYVVTWKGLYAINPDGTLKWEKDYYFYICESVSPALGDDGTIYGGCSQNFKAINPDDGNTKWVFNDKINNNDVGFRTSSPAIGPDGTIYVGSNNTNYLYAINPDGTLKWKFEANYIINSSPAIGEDGTIYVGSDDDNLYAINPDGTLKWYFETGDDIKTSPVIDEDGTIYVGSWDDYLYAINPDGTLKWKFNTGTGIFHTPVIGSNGIIYVIAYRYLYALNEDGTLLWKFSDFKGASSWPSVFLLSLSNDGTLYVSDYESLYAIETDSQGLANSPWPKFQKNNRNTGNYKEEE
ncbi:MAG: hypothetical protein PWP54_640 [Thermosipho sp. (in: thermotogales)]|nr:hypothetical protein [Thermosipho sp. (in: thermotogales)]MDN5324603.1 hypothetical protein [Thermosipho sp. (in: thermotogales)]